MKIIFLDFDGVLNCAYAQNDNEIGLMPEKMPLLKQIIDATDARIKFKP